MRGNLLILLFILLPLLGYADIGSDDDYDSFADPAPATDAAVTIETAPDSLKAQADVDYEYFLGPGDLLEIEVFMVKDLSHSTRVNSKGFISMPLAGTMQVAGLTVAEVERLIEERLSKEYLQNPHVSVFIREYESQKVTVNGWVKNPGVFPLKGKTTLLQVISLANGLAELSDAGETVIFRKLPGKGTVGYKIDIRQVQSGQLNDPVLLAGDIIVVPQDGSKAALKETRENLRFFLGFIPFF